MIAKLGTGLFENFDLILKQTCPPISQNQFLIKRQNKYSWSFGVSTN
jgi:hypothetical protein